MWQYTAAYSPPTHHGISDTPTIHPHTTRETPAHAHHPTTHYKRNSCTWLVGKHLHMHTIHPHTTRETPAPGKLGNSCTCTPYCTPTHYKRNSCTWLVGKHLNMHITFCEVSVSAHIRMYYVPVVMGVMMVSCFIAS